MLPCRKMYSEGAGREAQGLSIKVTARLGSYAFKAALSNRVPWGLRGGMFSFHLGLSQWQILTGSLFGLQPPGFITYELSTSRIFTYKIISTTLLGCSRGFFKIEIIKSYFIMLKSLNCSLLYYTIECDLVKYSSVWQDFIQLDGLYWEVFFMLGERGKYFRNTSGKCSPIKHCHKIQLFNDHWYETVLQGYCVELH